MQNPDFSNMLSAEEIQARLQAFWDSGEQDWSVFNDVPPVQQVCVMYPHRIVKLDIETYLFNKNGEAKTASPRLHKAKRQLNRQYGIQAWLQRRSLLA